MHLLIRVTIWMFLVSLASVISAQQPTPSSTYETANVFTDIAYAEGDEADERRILDIYMPQQAVDVPVLLFVSGGGWSSGSRIWVETVGVSAALNGIGAVLIDHRVAPDVNYMQQVQDLALAYGWVRENIAEFGGNPDRLFIGGHSAGAHLTSLLVLDPQFLEEVGEDGAAIRGVMPVSGPLVLSDNARQQMDVFLNSELASPITHVRPNLPPFLLIVAEDDYDEVLNANRLFGQALARAGVGVLALTIENRNHFNIMTRWGSDTDAAALASLRWIYGIQRALDDETTEAGS